jgi:hypothetical protein
VTLREEHRLRVFESRMLRRIFDAIGGLRKLHNDELHNLYSLPSIITVINSRTIKWAGYVAHMGEKRNVYRMLN